jgi:hypothetical protein
LDCRQVGSHVLDYFAQKPFFSENKSLTGQMDALVGASAEKRLEGNLETAQLGDFGFRRL